MKAEDFHKAMRPVNEACVLAKSGWSCLSNPLVGWGEEGMIRWKIGILLRHIALVPRCLKKASSPHILIREFSSVPLLLVFPFLLPLRKKLFFMVHQNIQWAAQRKCENIALSALSKMGARWAILETQDFPGFMSRRSSRTKADGKYNIPSEKNLVLPHPVPRSPLREGCPQGGEGSPAHPVPRSPLREGCPQGGEGSPVIGVVGYYRAEKGMDELVGLLKEKLSTCRGEAKGRSRTFGILLGVPNPDEVKHLDVETIDTSTDEAYREMISRCDVLVQNGAADSYFYRASGPIADAAACGTAVVAPGFPLIRHQLTSPVSIGEVFLPMKRKTGAGSACFQTLDLSESESAFGTLQKKRPAGEWQNLPDAVRAAVEKVRNGQYDFDAYCAARSAQALAKRLDEFSREQNGKS